MRNQGFPKVLFLFVVIRAFFLKSIKGWYTESSTGTWACSSPQNAVLLCPWSSVHRRTDVSDPPFFELLKEIERNPLRLSQNQLQKASTTWVAIPVWAMGRIESCWPWCETFSKGRCCCIHCAVCSQVRAERSTAFRQFPCRVPLGVCQTLVPSETQTPNKCWRRADAVLCIEVVCCFSFCLVSLFFPHSPPSHRYRQAEFVQVSTLPSSSFCVLSWSSSNFSCSFWILPPWVFENQVEDFFSISFSNLRFLMSVWKSYLCCLSWIYVWFQEFSFLCFSLYLLCLPSISALSFLPSSVFFPLSQSSSLSSPSSFLYLLILKTNHCQFESDWALPLSQEAVPLSTAVFVPSPLSFSSLVWFHFCLVLCCSLDLVPFCLALCGWVVCWVFQSLQSTAFAFWFPLPLVEQTQASRFCSWWTDQGTGRSMYPGGHQWPQKQFAGVTKKFRRTGAELSSREPSTPQPHPPSESSAAHWNQLTETEPAKSRSGLSSRSRISWIICFHGECLPCNEPCWQTHKQFFFSNGLCLCCFILYVQFDFGIASSGIDSIDPENWNLESQCGRLEIDMVQLTFHSNSGQPQLFRIRDLVLNFSVPSFSQPQVFGSDIIGPNADCTTQTKQENNCFHGASGFTT